MMTDMEFSDRLREQQLRLAKQWAEERAAYEQMRMLQLQGTYKFEIRRGEVKWQSM